MIRNNLINKVLEVLPTVHENESALKFIQRVRKEMHRLSFKKKKNTSFFNLTLTWSHRKGASSPAARGELVECPWPWWIASSSGLTGDSTCLSSFRRLSLWMNPRTLSTDSRIPQMLPLIPSGASIIPPETRWKASAWWGTSTQGQKHNLD